MPQKINLTMVVCGDNLMFQIDGTFDKVIFHHESEAALLIEEYLRWVKSTIDIIEFISEIERQERESIFLQNANTKHGTKFDYSKVHYINNTEKVTIICKIHGEFTQSPAKHLSYKHACPECAKIAQGMSRRIDKSYLIQEAKKLYGNIVTTHPIKTKKVA